MADSKIQLLIEAWIREKWLPEKYGEKFSAQHLQLNTEGYFDFDAVSTDRKIVVNISTSSCRTSGGNISSAKIQKLRADMLFLTMVEADKKIIALSEKDMYDYLLKEKKNGRVPNEIDFIHAPIPEHLTDALTAARKIAVDEVTPVNE